VPDLSRSRPFDVSAFAGEFTSPRSVNRELGRQNLALMQWAKPVGTSCVFRYGSTSALWLILQFGNHNCLHALDGRRRLPVWPLEEIADWRNDHKL
jgi:hypothetical protein